MCGSGVLCGFGREIWILNGQKRLELPVCGGFFVSGHCGRERGSESIELSAFECSRERGTLIKC